MLTHSLTELNYGFDDVAMLDLSVDFYQEYAALHPCPATSDSQQAGSTQRRGCAVDNRAFHSATNVALRELVVPCRTCTHVLLTDVGHGYSFSFLGTALAYPADLVMASFYRQGKPVVAEVKPGAVDMAAVLMRHHVVESDGALFLHSFPRSHFAERGADWREGNDEDYLFVKMAVDDGMSLVVLSEEFLVHAF